MSALKQAAPVLNDPLFAAVRRAKVGSPVLVYAPTGEPAFWLIPFILRDRVCGLAEISLAGQLSRLGILGAAPDDQQSWFDPSFFEEPPASFLAEIAAHYGDTALSAPVLTYDGSPAKWAWRVQVAGSRGADPAIFITPAGWYVGQARTASVDREG